MVSERKLVLALANKFQTYNPFELCDAMGISIVWTPLNSSRGFYQRELETDTIYIDPSLPLPEQEFVCAHELGHVLMHGGTNAIFLANHTYTCMNKYERRANRFAAMLLWPDDGELIEFADLSLEQLSTLMGIPEELVAWRYQQIGS